MVDYPDSLKRLINELARLPGVGQKSAERFAFFILYEDREAGKRIASAIQEILSNISVCSRCNNIAESDLCWLCSDPKRKKEFLCVVEQPQDIIAFEKSGAFNGKYFVLGGLISPLSGVSAAELPFGKLRRIVEEDGVKEVIVATNPTTEGDVTALEVKRALEGLCVKVTRIAKGMPQGAAVQFASPFVLRDSFLRRIDVD
jgi:recombination protein RecR